MPLFSLCTLNMSCLSEVCICVHFAFIFFCISLITFSVHGIFNIILQDLIYFVSSFSFNCKEMVQHSPTSRQTDITQKINFLLELVYLCCRLYVLTVEIIFVSIYHRSLQINIFRIKMLLVSPDIVALVSVCGVHMYFTEFRKWRFIGNKRMASSEICHFMHINCSLFMDDHFGQ